MLQEQAGRGLLDLVRVSATFSPGDGVGTIRSPGWVLTDKETALWRRTGGDVAPKSQPVLATVKVSHVGSCEQEQRQPGSLCV